MKLFRIPEVENKWTTFLFIVAYFIVFGAHAIYHNFVPQIGTAFTVVRIIVFAVALVWISRVYFKRFHILLLLYAVLLYIISVINSAEETNAVFSYVMTFLTLIIIFSVQSSRNFRESLFCISTALAAFVWINLILVLIYPDGIWQKPLTDYWILKYYWLGGNYNQFGSVLICACATSLAYRRYVGAPVNWPLLIAAIVQLLMVGSKTSTVGIVLLTIVAFLKKGKPLRIFITSIFVVFIVFQLIIFFAIDYLSQIDLVQYMVVDILNKDLTFTGRDFIWMQCKEYIMDSPWFGYGFRGQQWYADNIATENGGLTAHNLVFSILIKGGLALFLLYIYIFFTSVKDYLKQRSEVVVFFMAGSFVMLLMQITEVYSMVWNFYLLLMIVECEFCLEKEKDTELVNALQQDAIFPEGDIYCK